MYYSYFFVLYIELVVARVFINPVPTYLTIATPNTPPL